MRPSFSLIESLVSTSLYDERNSSLAYGISDYLSRDSLDPIKNEEISPKSSLVQGKESKVYKNLSFRFSKRESTRHGDTPQIQRKPCSLSPNGTWAHVPLSWLTMMSAIMDVINEAIQINDISTICKVIELYKNFHSEMISIMPTGITNLEGPSKIKVPNLKHIDSFLDVSSRRSLPRGRASMLVNQFTIQEIHKYTHVISYINHAGLGDELLECLRHLQKSTKRRIQSIRLSSNSRDTVHDNYSEEYSDPVSLSQLFKHENPIVKEEEFKALLRTKFEYDTSMSDMEPEKTDSEGYDDSRYSEFDIKYDKPQITNQESDLDFDDDILLNNQSPEEKIAFKSKVLNKTLLVSSDSLIQKERPKPELRPKPNYLQQKMATKANKEGTVGGKKQISPLENTKRSQVKSKIKSKDETESVKTKTSKLSQDIQGHKTFLESNFLETEIVELKSEISRVSVVKRRLREKLVKKSLVRKNKKIELLDVMMKRTENKITKSNTIKKDPCWRSRLQNSVFDDTIPKNVGDRKPFSFLKDCSKTRNHVFNIANNICSNRNEIFNMKTNRTSSKIFRSFIERKSRILKIRYYIKPRESSMKDKNEILEKYFQNLKSESFKRTKKYYHLYYPKIIPSKVKLDQYVTKLTLDINNGFLNSQILNKYKKTFAL